MVRPLQTAGRAPPRSDMASHYDPLACHYQRLVSSVKSFRAKPTPLTKKLRTRIVRSLEEQGFEFRDERHAPPDMADKAEIIDGLVYSTRVLGFVNAPAFMQRAVQASLDAQVDVAWYQQQRDRVAQGLTSMGYSLVQPQGAFYVFPASPTPDDVAFSRELLEHRVLVTPGTGFGGPGHFRISYSVQERVLEGALEGLSKAARAHGLPG